MPGRTLKALCFTIALTSTALCFAQSRPLTKDDVRKVVAGAEKRIADCESQMNSIRIQGRALGPSDFKRLDWFKKEIEDIKYNLSWVKNSLSRKTFSFSTDERVCFDALRATLNRKNTPPISALRLNKKRGQSGLLRPVKESKKKTPKKKTSKKKKARKKLSPREQELREIQIRKERVELEIQAADAQEDVQIYEKVMLTARLERMRYEAAHEDWEKKIESMEKSGKLTEIAKLEIRVKQASLKRSISKHRKEELEAELRILGAQKRLLTAQQGIENWERSHGPKTRITKVEVRQAPKHWVAAKLEMTGMETMEKDINDLFKWCETKKLKTVGPVVNYFPRFFLGAAKLDKLGLGVVLAEKSGAIKDPVYAVESLKPMRVLSIHVRGPYEKSLEKIGDAIAILKKKKLKPIGPLVVYYHSDPKEVEAEDLLTEITIPVEKD